MNLWTVYQVRWDFLGNLCGSVPADPEIVKAWIEARKPRAVPPNAKSLNEITEEVFATLAAERDGEDESNILTFQRHADALCMRAGTVRAHLKDCARVLSGYTGRLDKERSFATRFINAVYPDEAVYWMPILRPDGTPVTKHDSERDKPIRTRSGQSALKRFEIVNPARLDFVLKVLKTQGGKATVSREDLERVMTYGGVHGYAGERGDGEGKYTFTLEEIS